MASDRDRISAARYVALKLHRIMSRTKRSRSTWSHWIDSNAGITSETGLINS